MRSKRLFLAFVSTITLCVVILACKPEPNPGPAPQPTPAPTVGALSVCGKYLCYEGTKVFLVGMSNYGTISHGKVDDYSTGMELWTGNGINLMREWVCPYPFGWGGVQPYLFSNGQARLNEEFWQKADALVSMGAVKGTWFLLDLVDRYGVEPDRRNDQRFGDSPLNAKHGGPLKNGLPDLYDVSSGTSPIIEMARLGVRRLSKYDNIIYQICNEPVKYSSPEQLARFHRAMALMIRQEHPKALIALNPVPDRNGRPTIPSINAVGQDSNGNRLIDLVTLHGAGVENVKDRGTCTPAAVRDRLNFLQSRFLHVPVISDTDGLHDKRNACSRHDNAVLFDMMMGADQQAGFNHRDFEYGQGDPIDHEALEILRKAPK